MWVPHCSNAGNGEANIDQVVFADLFTMDSSTGDLKKKDPLVIQVHFRTKIQLYIHPGKLTWNIIMEVWKIIFLSKWVIYMFHVNLPGCNFHF